MMEKKKKNKKTEKHFLSVKVMYVGTRRLLGLLHGGKVLIKPLLTVFRINTRGCVARPALPYKNSAKALI